MWLLLRLFIYNSSVWQKEVSPLFVVAVLRPSCVWWSMKHVYCTPVICSVSLNFPTAFSVESGDGSETEAVQSKHLLAPRSLVVSLPHCTGDAEQKTTKDGPTWFLNLLSIRSPCLLQSSRSPFSPQNLSDDALSPSYLTQVTGATFDKCKHIVFISEDLEKCCRFLWEPVVVVEVPNVFAQRKMFLTCCFTYINTFQ